MKTQRTVRADRYTTLPAAIAAICLGLFFGFSYASTNFDRNGDIFAILFAVCTFATQIVLFFVRAVRRRWRASASIGLAAMLFVGCFLAKGEIFFAMDRARFILFRDYYVRALPLENPADPQGLRVVRWGFWGYFISGQFYRELVYDPVDALASPDALQTPRVREALQNAESAERVSECRTFVSHLEAHFYIVDIACP